MMILRTFDWERFELFLVEINNNAVNSDPSNVDGTIESIVLY